MGLTILLGEHIASDNIQKFFLLVSDGIARTLSNCRTQKLDPRVVSDQQAKLNSKKGDLNGGDKFFNYNWFVWGRENSGCTKLRGFRIFLC